MLAFSSRRTFLIANLVHLIIELCEVHTCASGERMESFSNHVSDTIAFLIGTAIGSELKRRLNLMPFWLICHILRVYILYGSFKEIYREVRPLERVVTLVGTKEIELFSGACQSTSTVTVPFGMLASMLLLVWAAVPDGPQQPKLEHPVHVDTPQR